MEAVAKKANCSIPTVSEFCNGVKNSKRVGKALAEILGYASFADLMAAARSKGGVA
jgi:DNA-binding LacI/PurR family transcriptional regulator